MEICCPVCRKVQETSHSEESVACIRCEAELSPLVRIEFAALGHHFEALNALRHRDYTNALDWADRSWEYRHLPQTARVGCLAAAAGGNRPALELWRRRVQQTDGSV